jgi:hypothetical protein
MEDFNLTANSDRLFNDIKERTDIFWFFLHHDKMNWMLDYLVPKAMIITKLGFCINFNLLPSKKLFNLNKY